MKIFSIFFKKTLDEVSKPKNPKEIIFKKHNLSKWTYLGWRNISYYRIVNKKEEITSDSNIYFFLNKNDETRSYYIENDHMKNHEYVTHTVEEWMAEIKHLAYPVINPTEEFKEIMKKSGYKWVDTWWVSIDDEKKIKKSIINKKENVVSVDFSIDKKE